MLEVLSCVVFCEGEHGFLIILFLHLMVVDCAVEYPINNHFGCDALSKLILYSLPHTSTSCQVTPYSYHHIIGPMKLKRNSSSDVTLSFFGTMMIFLLIGKWPCWSDFMTLLSGKITSGPITRCIICKQAMSFFLQS